MTALAAARATESKSLGNVTRYLMTVSETVYAGGMVMITSAGTAQAAASSASNRGVVGLATETVVAAASGDTWVNVQAGIFKMAGTTLGQDDVGKMVYAADDQTVDEADSGSLPVAGRMVEYVGASEAWVAMGLATMESADQTVSSILTFPVTMASIADGDVVTTITPGFAGTIEKVYWVQDAAVTTAAKLSTLNLEIGTTNVTGGVISLTSAACTPQGAVIAGTAITALNTFGATDTISVEASSTTTFIEGTGSVQIVLSQNVTK